MEKLTNFDTKTCTMQFDVAVTYIDSRMKEGFPGSGNLDYADQIRDCVDALEDEVSVNSDVKIDILDHYRAY